MLQNEYLAKVREVIDRLEASQAGPIDALAAAVADGLANGKAIFIAPLGHGNEGDLLHRAGGLMAANRFNYSFHVDQTIAASLKDREREQPFEAELETARLAVCAGHLRRGDFLILGSVSGRSARWVACAIAAREIGVRVIAITSLEYTAKVESSYPTGEKLCEVADFVIDNCVPYGDACMEVEGLAVRAFPLSGLTTTMACWMLCAQVVEHLLAKGLRPHVYMSANRADGPDFNAREEAEYGNAGY